MSCKVLNQSIPVLWARYLSGQTDVNDWV